MTNLLSYERFVDNQNAILCEKLQSMASSTSPLDIPKWMQLYAFDVIGEVTVGKSFGFMRAEGDNIGILKAIHDAMVYGCLLYTSPSPRDGLLSRMPSSA